jgi:hypothetical protein
MGTGGRKRPERDADSSPSSSAEVYKQGRAIPLLSLRAFVACVKSETYLQRENRAGVFTFKETYRVNIKLNISRYKTQENNILKVE